MSLLPFIENPHKSAWSALLARPNFETKSLNENVRHILDAVKTGGDDALKAYSRKFDKVNLEDLHVSDQEFLLAENLVDEALKISIKQAKENITRFHKMQLSQEPEVEIAPGIRCGRKSVAIEKVGLYIPGGTAPLFSTVLMLGIPARLAGCSEIILCTPPQSDGSVHPAILFTAGILGIRTIYKIGGAQAIAAMAYGTETIPRVDKIFGPGNQFVTQAKKLIQMEGIAIDMPAGPSELAIYADDTSVPEYIAADLLSQCEHGPDSQVILITAHRQIAESVREAILMQLERLPRKSVAGQALQNSKMILLPDAATAMEMLNLYAPEHLILACRNAAHAFSQVRNAGSVFLGNFAPESAGDYASGTNHTLPTNGFARAYSGVSVDSFIKKISFQELTREGLESIRSSVVHMAEAEGLKAHAEAVQIRFRL